MTKKMRMEKGLLKLGEIAEKAGIQPTTVRYYTDVGLLKVVDYTRGGYRLYDKDDTIDRIRTIKEINSTKVTLSQIKDKINN